jgi:hypothetical protein
MSLPVGRELAWDARAQACVLVAVSPAAAPQLGQFRWTPPELELEPATHTGRAIRAFRGATAHLAFTSDARTFVRLSQHPDYDARFQAGYEQGREDGFDEAAAQWVNDYTDMLAVMAEALSTVASEAELRNQFLIAAIDELLFRTFDRSGRPVWKDPRYRELIEALRPAADGAAAPIAEQIGDLDEDVAEMLEVAAHADAMRRVPQRLWDSRILERIDLQIADWVTEFNNEASSLLADVLALNCRPYDQGYLVGSWTSQAIVNTMRRAVEAVLRQIGSNPELLLPMSLLGKISLSDRALDALIQAVSIELLDED